MTSEVIEIFPAYEEYLQPARFKVCYGGRGSAKTRTICTILTTNVLYYGWRVVALREIMESVAESVYQEFVEEIARRDLGAHFEILKTEIKCITSGGVIKFSGIKSNSKTLNSQKLKGFSNFDAAWLEEAESVSAESWNALIPTMRKPGSEIWVSYNPKNPLDETHKRFVTQRTYPDFKDGKRYCIVKKINYTDNPRFPKELRDDLELMRANDPELYRHVYMGEPVGDSDLSVIKPMWISAAVDAHKVLGISPSGGVIGGFDVSDEGEDANALAWRHGVIVRHLEEWKDQDPNSAATYVFNRCLSDGVQLLNFDNIGVGAGAKGQFRQLLAGLHHHQKPPRVEGFNAGAAVLDPDSDYMPGKKNRDMFVNLKAQAWWQLGDRFRNTYDAVNGKPYDHEKLICLPSDLPSLEKLKAELAQPRRCFVNGKVKVESKEDMKKRGIKSPNLADALVMCFAPEPSFDLSALL